MNVHRTRAGAGAGGGVHQFKWDQQGSQVLEQLRSLYGDHEGVGDALGIQPDVVLFSSDGGCEEAHRMVLALCSSYFQQLFQKISQTQLKHQRCRDTPAVVVLGNVKAYQLKQLLQFIYTGEVTVPSDQMEAFLELGKTFKIEGIAHSTSSKKSTTVSSPSTYRSAKIWSKYRNRKSRSPVNVTPPEPEDRNSLQDCLDEDGNFSYDSIPVKVEPESREMEWSGDPLASYGEESNSSDDQDKNDPDYHGDKNPPGRRGRKRDSITTRLAAAVSHLPSVAPKKKKVVNWAEQEPLSDEALRCQWHVYTYRQNESCNSTLYSCAPGGRKCPARLKKKVMKDGTVIWQNNQVAHNPHPKEKRPRGLSQEQKQFVLQLLESGVTTPTIILRSFEDHGLESPGLQKLQDLLRYVNNKKIAQQESAGGSQPAHQFSMEEILQ